jgi:hypothetical protein
VEDEVRLVAERMEGSSLKKWSSSQHGEEVYAVETFFWGRTRGSFLELGAVDGELFSNTLGIFERILAWRGILIEASPQSFEILPHKRPNQISVHAAICGEARDVHWADSTVKGFDHNSVVSGIAEFLHPEHRARFQTKLVDTQLTWEQNVDRLPVVRCLPLGVILGALEAFHINFFVLDVEGAEMSVLTSLDWARFSFDVLAIESQYSSEDNDAIQRFLSDRGYDIWGAIWDEKGLNAEEEGKTRANNWFVRRGFQPSQRPR